jgi:hypothetical protein
MQEVDMQRDEVISILESLAHGQTPAVMEALITATNVLRKNPRPDAAGQRWTDDEDARLCREFDEGRPIRELAQTHGRTRGAITSRLVKLGRLEASAVTTRERGARVTQ